MLQAQVESADWWSPVTRPAMRTVVKPLGGFNLFFHFVFSLLAEPFGCRQFLASNS
jgi:hypothetical protein